MNALKNLTHTVILGIWVVAGLLFTVSSLFGHLAVGPVLVFWLWFAGFAALTSMVAMKFEGPIGALLTHAGALLVLNVIPQVFPLSLLRIGYDLLISR